MAGGAYYTGLIPPTKHGTGHVPDQEDIVNKSYLNSAILIAINIGILVWWYANTSGAALPPEEPLTVGDPFPEITLTDQNRKIVNLKTWSADHWSLIMYCRNNLPWQNIHYLQTLADHYQDQPFKTAIIINEEASLSFSKNQILSLKTPLFGETENKAATSLGLYRDGVFLINPDGQVAFSAAFMLKREDLRKITEKFLRGEITYQSGEAIQPNKKSLESLTVYHSAYDDYDQLKAPDNAHFFVLTAAMCSVCNTDSYFDLIAKTIGALQTNEKTKNDYVALLLTAGFDLEKAKQSLLEHRIDVDLLQATTKIESFEDEYFTDRTGDLPKMIAASIDARGVMTSQSVSQLLNSLGTQTRREEAHHAD